MINLGAYGSVSKVFPYKHEEFNHRLLKLTLKSQAWQASDASAGGMKTGASLTSLTNLISELQLERLSLRQMKHNPSK